MDTDISRYMVSSYLAMSVIMMTMNTDMWTMHPDHVDHEH